MSQSIRVTQAPLGWSVEGMARLLRHGRLHFGAVASCIAACYPATSRQVYVQVTALWKPTFSAFFEIKALLLRPLVITSKTKLL